jgi:hypothetical protein
VQSGRPGLPGTGAYALADRVIEKFDRKGCNTIQAFSSYADGMRVGLWERPRAAPHPGSAGIH